MAEKENGPSTSDNVLGQAEYENTGPKHSIKPHKISIDSKIHLRVVAEMRKRPLSTNQIRDMGCSNAADTIMKLKAKGLGIVTMRVNCVNMDGQDTWFGRYHLDEAARRTLAQWDAERDATSREAEAAAMHNWLGKQANLDGIEPHATAADSDTKAATEKQTTTEKRAAATEAEEFIVSLLLANGPMQSAEIYFKADEAGHALRTVQRVSGDMVKAGKMVKVGSGSATKWALADSLNSGDGEVKRGV